MERLGLTSDRHIVSESFNKLEGEAGNEVDNVLKTVGEVNGYEAEIILREAYDIAYGICDHNREDISPLSLVKMHPSEDYEAISPFKQKIKRYYKYEVFDKFGLNLTDFFKLPRDVTEYIFQLLYETALEENPNVQDELDKIEKSIKRS